MMKKTNQIKTLIFLFFFSFSFSSFAIDISFRTVPQTGIPLSSMKYSDQDKIIEKPSFGLSETIDINFLNCLAIGPEFIFNFIQKNGNPSFLIDIAPGLSFSTFYAPLSRLELQAGASTGFHFMSYSFPGIENSSGGYDDGNEPKKIILSSLYFKGVAGAAFRLSPDLSIGAQLGYTNYLLNKFSFSDTALSTFDIGINLKYTIHTSKTSKNIDADFIQFDSLFPVYANIYKENGFAFANIINNENAEIRDVKVFFRAENYTSSLFQCGTIPIIRKGKSAEIPLLADFSQEIASITENGQIPGEIIIEYSMLGKQKTAVETCIIDVYNRNSLKWADPAVLAMFVSPNATEVLELSKYIVGIARDSLKTGVNRNLQFATWITEAINSMGIDYVPDATTPYNIFHFDMDSVDQVQFPFQTLTYHSGDVDDLAVLFCALLQAAGIDSAMIPLSEDFIVCVSLNASEKGASAIVNNKESLIIINDEVWLPLSMKNLKLGFNKAWSLALSGIESEELGSEMIILRDAWQNYAPLGISGKAIYEKANPVDLKKRADSSVSKYLETEIQPKIKVQLSLVSSNPTEDNLNTLGRLYVTTGEMTKAKDVYNRSAKLGSISGMSNLANILLLEKDYIGAKRWYNKVLELNPEHNGAKKGLDRIANEQGN